MLHLRPGLCDVFCVHTHLSLFTHSNRSRIRFSTTEFPEDSFPPLDRTLPGPSCDDFSDPFCVAPDTHERGGGHRIEEVQTYKVEPWNFLDDPKLVIELTLFSNDRQIDPWKAVMVSRAPDHVLHVEYPAIFDQRETFNNSDCSRNAHDSSIVQVVGLDAHKRRRTGKHLLPHLTTDRCLYREDVMTEKPYQARQEESCEEAFNSKRNMT